MPLSDMSISSGSDALLEDSVSLSLSVSLSSWSLRAAAREMVLAFGFGFAFGFDFGFGFPLGLDDLGVLGVLGEPLGEAALASMAGAGCGGGRAGTTARA